MWATIYQEVLTTNFEGWGLSQTFCIISTFESCTSGYAERFTDHEEEITGNGIETVDTETNINKVEF